VELGTAEQSRSAGSLEPRPQKPHEEPRGQVVPQELVQPEQELLALLQKALEALQEPQQVLAVPEALTEQELQPGWH